MAVVTVFAGDWMAAGGICICGFGGYAGSGGVCVSDGAGLFGERDSLCRVEGIGAGFWSGFGDVWGKRDWNGRDEDE